MQQVNGLDVFFAVCSFLFTPKVVLSGDDWGPPSSDYPWCLAGTCLLWGPVWRHLEGGGVMGFRLFRAVSGQDWPSLLCITELTLTPVEVGGGGDRMADTRQRHSLLSRQNRLCYRARASLELSGVLTKGYIMYLQHICRLEMPKAALLRFLFVFVVTLGGIVLNCCTSYSVSRGGGGSKPNAISSLASSAWCSVIMLFSSLHKIDRL